MASTIFMAFQLLQFRANQFLLSKTSYQLQPLSNHSHKLGLLGQGRPRALSLLPDLSSFPIHPPPPPPPQPLPLATNGTCRAGLTGSPRHKNVVKNPQADLHDVCCTALSTSCRLVCSYILCPIPALSVIH